jgi:hypothetical protein
MPDPFAKTRYRVAQHWRFRNDTPEASDILIILGVEDHPTQGIICEVAVEYDPPFQMSPSSSMSGGQYWVTQTALDRSVLELVAEKGPLPQSFGTTGDFRWGPEFWERSSGPMAVDRTVGELIRVRTEEHKCERDELAAQPPHQKPPVESLGLWSLISSEEIARLRELFRQHPALANDPLPLDASDDYCYGYLGEEYEECYPLMMAARWGCVKVAELLFEFGADPKKRNARGDTALHFAGRSSNRFKEVAKIARMLCERGVDPEARNADGKTALTCGYCSTEVAEVLIHFGAKPTLNHAIRLRMLDWARRELRDNPNAVRDTVFPGEILDDLGFLIRDEAERRHGREMRVCRGETPSDGEDGWPDRMAYSEAMSFRMADDGSYVDDGKLATWRRHAEIERAVFEEHRDLLDAALARGAHPNAGSVRFDAVQMFDTSLAEWLRTHGADPNRDVKRGIANYLLDLARTRRMVNLLHRYGAEDNPYTKARDPWDERLKMLTDRLKEQFD